MNQGARDANAESARRGAQNTQEQILDELKKMTALLKSLVNHLDRSG